MRPFRRSTAAIVNLLLLQLSLVGSGLLGCEVQAGHGASGLQAIVASSASDGMADMTTDAGGEPCEPAPGDSRTHHCPLPWAPAGCTAMTACATVAVPSRVTAAATVASLDVAPWADAASVPLGPSPAPEPPPPRA